MECSCEDDKSLGSVKCGEFRCVTLNLFENDSASCNSLVT